MKRTENWLDNISRLMIVFILTVMAAGAAGIPVLAEEPAPAASVSPIDVSKIEIGGVEKLNLGPYVRFTWSPDGKKALVSKTVRGHQVQRLQREGAEPMEGDWTFVFDLWVLDWAPAQEEQIPGEAIQSAWSPDSSAIAYVAPGVEREIAGTLRVVDLADKIPHDIAQADIVANPMATWLPTNEIVYVSDGHFWVVEADGSNPRRLNDLKLEYGVHKGDVRDFSISPNGKYIAYTAWVSAPVPDSGIPASSGVWLADIDGGNVQLIAADASLPDYPWSPNGELLAYRVWPPPEVREAISGLAILNALTGEQHTVYEPPNPYTDAGKVVWSPDSSVLVHREAIYGGDQPKYVLRFTNADGSQQKAFENVEILQHKSQAIRWGGDGDFLLIRIPRGTSIVCDLYRLELNISR